MYRREEQNQVLYDPRLVLTLTQCVWHYTKHAPRTLLIDWDAVASLFNASQAANVFTCTLTPTECRRIWRMVAYYTAEGRMIEDDAESDIDIPYAKTIALHGSSETSVRGGGSSPKKKSPLKKRPRSPVKASKIQNEDTMQALDSAGIKREDPSRKKRKKWSAKTDALLLESIIRAGGLSSSWDSILVSADFPDRTAKELENRWKLLEKHVFEDRVKNDTIVELVKTLRSIPQESGTMDVDIGTDKRLSLKGGALGTEKLMALAAEVLCEQEEGSDEKPSNSWTSTPGEATQS